MLIRKPLDQLNNKSYTMGEIAEENKTINIIINNNNNNNEIVETTDGKVEKLIKGKLLRFARKRRLLCKNGKIRLIYI